MPRDLADVRDHLSEAAISSTTDVGPAAAAAVRADRTRCSCPVAAAALATAAAAGGLAAGKRLWYREPPTFKQLTFRRGQIASARFAPDGQTILYSAAWAGNPMDIYVSRPESPESRPFGLPGAEILAVSKSGEMA